MPEVSKMREVAETGFGWPKTWMQIKEISFQSFRNYRKRKVEFEGPTTVAVGVNGSGKTNLLEAIYLLATARSFRADLEEEMIGYEDEVARVEGEVVSGEGEKVSLGVMLSRGRFGDRRVGRKGFVVNGVPRRMVDFVGNFRAVLFGPWDLDLITDSPGLRRRYLDQVLVQIDGEYRRSLISYEKGLRQRNKLLERIRDGGASRGQLLFWDKLLIKNGDYLMRKRGEFLEFLNESGPLGESEMIFSCRYDRSVISEARLEQYAKEEVLAAATLVGPHRDEVKFYVGGGRPAPAEVRGQARDLSKFGSRGEQRLAVLWLKMGELEYLSRQGDRPALLLDDIFSELDRQHRQTVLTVLGRQQTLITAADEHYLGLVPKGVQVIQLEG